MSRMLSFRFVRMMSVVGTLFVAGCGIVDPLQRESNDLSYYWERWISAGYTSYDYIIIHDCFCVTGGIPVEVSVRGDRVVAVRYADTGTPLVTDLALQYRDVDGLFQLIDDALTRNAYSIDAAYNATYGFPRDVFIDYQRNAVDEEFGFRVVAFYPIR